MKPALPSCFLSTPAPFLFQDTNSFLCHCQPLGLYTTAYQAPVVVTHKQAMQLRSHANSTHIFTCKQNALHTRARVHIHIRAHALTCFEMMPLLCSCFASCCWLRLNRRLFARPCSFRVVAMSRLYPGSSASNDRLNRTLPLLARSRE